MGTNYYLRSKKIEAARYRTVVHVAKVSAGWRPLLQEVFADLDDVEDHRMQAIAACRPLPSSSDSCWAYRSGQEWIDEPSAPGVSVHSAQDVRDLLATGEWELVDECGDVCPPEFFDELLSIRDAPGRLPHAPDVPWTFTDPEGYDFERRDFS